MELLEVEPQCVSMRDPGPDDVPSTHGIAPAGGSPGTVIVKVLPVRASAEEEVTDVKKAAAATEEEQATALHLLASLQFTRKSDHFEVIIGRSPAKLKVQILKPILDLSFSTRLWRASLTSTPCSLRAATPCSLWASPPHATAARAPRAARWQCDRRGGGAGPRTTSTAQLIRARAQPHTQPAIRPAGRHPRIPPRTPAAGPPAPGQKRASGRPATTARASGAGAGLRRG
jgi:hypothetical protein